MIGRESVRITFHKVTRCGFYKWGSKVPEFGGLDRILTDLAAWTKGVELAKTKLSDGNPNKDALPVYLAGIIGKGRNWVFCTWNEVPSHEAGVPSISANSKVGDPQIHVNGIAAGSIPGYATYFWAIPEHNVIASLRFNHQTTGVLQMSGYMEQFMSTASSYVVKTSDTDPAAEKGAMKIVGYTDNDPDNCQKLFPYLRLTTLVKAGERQYILQNHQRIRKVLRRRTLSVHSPIDRDGFEKLVSFLRGKPAPMGVHVDRSAYVELEYTPTLAELKEMVAANDEQMVNGAWDDMGFVFVGEPHNKYWLAKSTASDNFNLLIDRVDEENVVLDSLLEQLLENKAEILKLLKDA